MNDGPSAPARQAFGNGIADELEWLFFEVNALASRLKVAARQLHLENRLPANGRALLQLLARNGPQTVPQLARARATSRQNIQTQINHFETEGWIRFTSNPAHRRSELVELTQRGEELLVGALQREANQLAPRLPDADEGEVMEAVTLLKRIRIALDPNTATTGVPLPSLPSRAARRKKRRAAERSSQTVKTVPEEPFSAEPDELPINLL
jgi:DNA-binding MarR family transcriptional regulator